MHPRLDTAPAYAWIALMSVVFTVVVTIWRLTSGDSWGEAVDGAAFAGVLFGVVMGPWTAHARREAHDVEGVITPEDYVTAKRFSAHGPLPRNPQVRETTTTLIEYRARHAEAHRTTSALLYALSGAVAAVIGALLTPEWFVIAAVMVFLSGHAWLEPARLHRRLLALRAPITPRQAA